MMRFFRLHNFEKIIIKKQLCWGQCLNLYIVYFYFYNNQNEVLSFKENKLERISIDEKLY